MSPEDAPVNSNKNRDGASASMAGDVGSEPTPRLTLATRFRGATSVADFRRVCGGGVAEAEMNETARGAAQSAGDDKVYARLEKDLTAVKKDVAHLSEQISEAVNALGAVAHPIRCLNPATPTCAARSN